MIIFRTRTNADNPSTSLALLLPLRWLLIERDCEKVIVELTRSVDEGRFDDALKLFTEDAVFVRRGQPLTGKSAIAEAFAKRPQNQITRHFLANISVSVEDPNRASAVTSVFVFRHLGTETPPTMPAPISLPDTVEEYRDVLIRDDNVWCIKHRETKEFFSAQ
jgi:hypothetical protein